VSSRPTGPAYECIGSHRPGPSPGTFPDFVGTPDIMSIGHLETVRRRANQFAPPRPLTYGAWDLQRRSAGELPTGPGREDQGL